MYKIKVRFGATQEQRRKVMKQKYFNDGMVGNGKLTASFSKTGELLRLFYGAVDYKQFIEQFDVGVKINDSAMVYLHNDINNLYSQKYMKDTNILQTEIVNTYFNLQIIQTDFVPMEENILVKNYRFINQSNRDLRVNLLAYSKVLTNVNNDTCGFFKDDCLIQYNHDYSLCIFAKEKPMSYQINNIRANIMDGVIGGKDYIGMSPDSAIAYDLKVLHPGEEVNLNLYIYVNDNKEKCLLNELDTEIARIRKIDIVKQYEDTKKYWRKVVKDYDKFNFEKKQVDSRIEKIYKRSILLFSLLTNPETGGISAGMEVDEGKTKCGRYSYCWTRDAVFVTRAMDILGMKENVEKFYNIFCKKTQSKTGRWQQRFYTDGRLAPCWGYQIDETASVVFGIYEHFKKYKDKMFLKNNLKMCENAVTYLQKYVDDVLHEKGKFLPSYDLWEEYEGVTLYSMASIFAGFDAMIKIYKNVKPMYETNRLKLEAINKKTKELAQGLLELKEYCLKTFFDEEKKTFVRNPEDRKMDISILGAITPFEMFKPSEKNVENTIERMNMTLRTYTGGYVRYEQDGYMGGYHPWPIANLWMACYNLEIREDKKALENFEFVTNSCSEHGFLGEQVNNETMQPAWIIGLTWSHAMYIVVLEKLLKKGLI